MSSRSIPTLKFIIDKKFDLQTIPMMVKAGSQLVPLPQDLFEKIRNNNSPETQGELKDFVNHHYAASLPYLRKSLKLYQKSWDEINSAFFQITAELTESPWHHKLYECVLSLYHPGLSNWGGNKIARWWEENPYTMRRITAHELIISHFFTIVKDKFPHANVPDQTIWKLAEIAAWALTGLEPKLNQFWPWDARGYYTNHNYPQLVELQIKLKQPYLERKSFADYISKGIELVKESLQ